MSCVPLNNLPPQGGTSKSTYRICLINSRTARGFSLKNKRLAMHCPQTATRWITNRYSIDRNAELARPSVNNRLIVKISALHTFAADLRRVTQYIRGQAQLIPRTHRAFTTQALMLKSVIN